ncbi:hypothetical protein GCM10023329_35550 [Streptomyces sanyensis]|uniref:Uncharacterized protein n=1 Tax=Streptomyces sanyensis TaxID=568869 RepID=A0ABP9AJW9_9ACTN
MRDPRGRCEERRTGYAGIVPCGVRVSAAAPWLGAPPGRAVAREVLCRVDVVQERGVLDCAVRPEWWVRRGGTVKGAIRSAAFG